MTDDANDDDENLDPPTIEVKDQNQKKWRFKFYFGNSKTFYGQTNAHIKTSRLDLQLIGLQPYERRSDSYYNNFFHESLQEMGQTVDEPTNTFTFSLVKNDKSEIFLKIFHPKFVFVEGNQDQVGHGYYNAGVQVSGTVDGQAVNGVMPLHAAFDPNTFKMTSQLGFMSWEDSHKLIQIEAGYGKQFAVIKSKGKPILEYTPEVSAGVYMGVQNASYVGKSNYVWDVDSYADNSNSNSDMKIMGVSASFSQRLELNNRNNDVGLFVEHKISYGKMDYAFLDGSVKHDISYNSFTVGFNLAIKPRATMNGIKSKFKKKTSATTLDPADNDDDQPNDDQ